MVKNKTTAASVAHILAKNVALREKAEDTFKNFQTCYSVHLLEIKHYSKHFLMENKFCGFPAEPQY